MPGHVDFLSRPILAECAREGLRVSVRPTVSKQTARAFGHEATLSTEQLHFVVYVSTVEFRVLRQGAAGDSSVFAR